MISNPVSWAVHYSLSRREKVPLLAPGGYNFVDVRDVVHAMINAMDREEMERCIFLQVNITSSGASRDDP